MVDDSHRGFLFGCGSAPLVLASTARSAPEASGFTAFERALLLDATGEPLRQELLEPEKGRFKYLE